MTLLISNEAIKFGNQDPLTAEEVLGQRAWGSLCGWGTVENVCHNGFREVAVIRLEDGLTAVPPLSALVEA